MTDYRAAAWDLNAGEMTQPILTDTGYSVILVAEIKPARVLEFDEAKGMIIARLKQGHLSQYMANLKKEVIAKNKVRLVEGADKKVRQALEALTKR